MTTTVVPILDPSVAADHLLDARSHLAAVRDSTLAGLPLHDAMEAAVEAVDSGLTTVRALSGAKAA